MAGRGFRRYGLGVRRGDLVTIALQGSYGKPRPALVVQSDLFAAHPSVTILPVTGELRPALLFRIDVAPSTGNGLTKPSQVMVDKAHSIPAEKVGPACGRLDDETMVAVNRALALFLGIA